MDTFRPHHAFLWAVILRGWDNTWGCSKNPLFQSRGFYAKFFPDRSFDKSNPQNHPYLRDPNQIHLHDDAEEGYYSILAISLCSENCHENSNG